MSTIPVQDPNPLSEASNRSLEELFSSDPTDLSKPDLAVVVKEMRAQAARWADAEAAGKTKAPRSATSKLPKVAAPPDLSLDDLGV